MSAIMNSLILPTMFIFFRNQEHEVDGKHVLVSDTHKTIVVEKGQFPKIDQFGTERMREGMYDFSLGVVDRKAEDAFYDFSPDFERRIRSTFGVTRFECALCKLGARYELYLFFCKRETPWEEQK